MSLIRDALQALRCRCPACGQGRIFDRSLNVVSVCDACGADLAGNDVGDGAVVFLLFILGFIIAPLAWLFDLWLAPPLWMHAIIWTVVALVMAVGLLPVVKSYVMLLEFRHRPGTGEKKDKTT